MILSIYSIGGWDIDFYDTIFTKLSSNKGKANKGLIWGIMLHYCKATTHFSIRSFRIFYAFQILILWSSGRKLRGVGRCPLLDRTYRHKPSYTSLESH